MLRFGLFLCMLCSLGIHVLLFFFVPSIVTPPLPAEEYTEVELRPLPLPPPPVELSEQLTPPEPLVEPAEETPPAPPEPPVVAEVAPPAPLADAEISALLDEDVVSLGLSLRPPAIDIEVPEAKVPDLEPKISASAEPGYAVEELFEKLGAATLPPGTLRGEALPLTMGNLEKLEREPESDIDLGDLISREPAVTEQVPAVNVAAEVIGADVQIRGPASGRGSPIYWPPSPEIGVAAETPIMLKFWVLPDGRVGQVVPLRVDDSALGAEALKFVSALRFRPLASFEKQENQWGTISLIFKPQ